MTLRCPPGVQPGGTVQFADPQNPGTMLKVRVPMGVYPGQNFRVRINSQPPSMNPNVYNRPMSIGNRRGLGHNSLNNSPQTNQVTTQTTQTIVLTCPPNVTSGQEIQFPLNGRTFRTKVPLGVRPGMQFRTTVNTTVDSNSSPPYNPDSYVSQNSNSSAPQNNAVPPRRSSIAPPAYEPSRDTSNRRPPSYEDTMTEILLQCPQGVREGQRIMFTSPDGENYQTVIPVGIRPGMRFRTQVRKRVAATRPIKTLAVRRAAQKAKVRKMTTFAEVAGVANTVIIAGHAFHRLLERSRKRKKDMNITVGLDKKRVEEYRIWSDKLKLNTKSSNVPRRRMSNMGTVHFIDSPGDTYLETKAKSGFLGNMKRWAKGKPYLGDKKSSKEGGEIKAWVRHLDADVRFI